MSLFRKGLILIALILAFQIGASAVLFWRYAISAQDAMRIERSMNLTSYLTTLILSMIQARGVLSKPHDDINVVRVIILKGLAALDHLNNDFEHSPQRRAVIDDALKKISQGLALMRVAQSKEHPHQSAKERSEIYKPLIPWAVSISPDLQEAVGFIREEDAFTRDSIKEQQRSRELTMILLYTGIVLELLLIGLTIGLFNRDVAKRMRGVLSNIESAGLQKPLNIKVSGADEIAQLDLAVRKVAKTLGDAAQNERALLDEQRDVICRIDEKLTLLQINQASFGVFGVSPDEMQSHSIADFVSGQASEQVRRQLEASKSGAPSPFETRIARGDGSELDMLWTVRWSPFDHSYFCVMRDISAQKRAERFRQEVLQMVSHDLKTPLTTVSGFLQMFETPILGSLTPSGKKQVSQGFDAATQMLSLIKDLLDMEKISAGMLGLQRSSVMLDEVMELAVDLVDTASSGKNVAVRVTCDVSNAADAAEANAAGADTAEAENARLEADRERILQVIVNLLNNAVRRSSPGGTVRLEAVRSGLRATGGLSAAGGLNAAGEFRAAGGLNATGAVEVRVTDYGPVIEASDLLRVFDRFLALDDASSADDEDIGAASDFSTGLSLAVSKALVELHGGRIRATSSAEHGTCFSFSIG